MMETPAALLCTELSRVLLTPVSVAEMERALVATGLTLTGGAKQAVAAHLAEVARMNGG